MKQIVLHLADYASKHGQVAGQYVQHGHPAQRMDDAARLLQYLDELATVDRVAPELGIDASAGMPHGTQCLRRHADDLRSFRSEERRVGKECVSKGRSGWSPDH